ncbi:hypothetical protein [Kribbella deserti]|uniref:Uncharacterized protein n=1 Tax=Kribbella deserti TaxID=1926257 RepID=A0ABV6QTH4_9ACTN
MKLWIAPAFFVVLFAGNAVSSIIEDRPVRAALYGIGAIGMVYAVTLARGKAAPVVMGRRQIMLAGGLVTAMTAAMTVVLGRILFEATETNIRLLMTGTLIAVWGMTIGALLWYRSSPRKTQHQ